MRFRLVLFACLVLIATAASSAVADDRTLLGFQDDPSFRWRADSAQMLAAAARQGRAAIVRTDVYWATTAPARPANPSDPFDPVYHFADLDQLIRTAEFNDMTVLLTIWGTPGWANGNRGPNYAPTNPGDLQAFARAVAARYSGRYPGLPFVGCYSVWNEPNLSEFLAPTFVKGRPASPAIYAGIARAAYAGIKSGNPLARVAIGETSPRGRDHPLPPGEKVGDTLSPGLFAQMVARAKPAVKFDAWAQHPYSDIGQGPFQRVRFPNVDLPELPTFERNLDRWFHRPEVPIWITEYGFQTRPGQPKGVSVAQQATYLKQTLAAVARDEWIKMFIWFIFRDDPTSTWHSGLLSEDSNTKPALQTFSRAAAAMDARNVKALVKVGGSNPLVRIPVWALAVRDGVGAKLGATISVVYGRRTTVAQPTSSIAVDGYAAFRLPITKARPNGLYVANLKINDANGNTLARQVTVIVK